MARIPRPEDGEPEEEPEPASGDDSGDVPPEEGTGQGPVAKPGTTRPLPRNLLLRPPPRRLPPIERDVELKADPATIPGGGRGRKRRGGRGRRGRPEPRPAPVPPAAPPETPAPPAASAPAPAPAEPPAESGFGPPPEAPPPPPPPPAPPEEARLREDHGEVREGRHGRGRRGRRGRGGGPGHFHGPAPSASPHQGPEPHHGPPPVPPPRPPSGPDLARWMEGPWKEAVARSPERKASFAGSSGAEKPPLAVPTPDLVAGFERNVGWPGSFPFTRGVQPTMYRGRPWTMRQYAGFASAAETNRRFRYLLERGQTGLSIAFDLPTQIGYDSDDPRSEGEVGKVGVPINSLADMETVLDGIPLDRVTVSMTINATAPILVAMVAAVAKRRGVPLEQVGGTVQNDLLKEFVARNLWRFPVEASLRLSMELIAFCVEQMPQWNPISVSGYHMREAGCTASQEVAFTLGHGLAYLDRCVKAGLPANRVAPRLSFFFAAQMDFFEEVAKFRAARRLWARLVREKFQGDDAACRLRFHTQTAGVALTSAQPDVNVVRVTLQALAAVMGGTQSLHTNSRDEALGLPTEEAVLLALRTQQVLAEESGVADVIDPLGGAPLVERETDRIEEEARALLREMDAQGGPVEAARKGWTQARIAEAAYRDQRAVESGAVAVVGVNRHTDGAAGSPPRTLRVDEKAAEAVVADLRKRRESRDARKLDEALFGLEIAAGWGGGGLMPAILRAVEAEATVGEICATLEKALGAFDPARP